MTAHPCVSALAGHAVMTHRRAHELWGNGRCWPDDHSRDPAARHRCAIMPVILRFALTRRHNRVSNLRASLAR